MIDSRTAHTIFNNSEEIRLSWPEILPKENKMRIHIVMPMFNNWNLTHSRLWELYKYEKDNISSVLIIDNGSFDDAVEGGLHWWKTENLLPISVVRFEENVGFLLASNDGIKAACNIVDYPNDIIILLSNDVQISGKFIDHIINIFNRNSDSLVGGVLYSTDTGWNKFGDRLFPYLEGWLLAARVVSWYDLEYFDEIFVPSDYEDIDLSTKALENGYELVPLNNPALVHLGAQTLKYGPERETRTKINQKKFEAKWVK